MILAMNTVQVTSDAKARPIMTALTTTSADMNIDHGENSRISVAAAFSSLPPSRSGGGVAASEAGAVAVGAGAGAVAGGEAGWLIVTGACGGGTLGRC